jgi:hypothetical protein
MNVKKSDYRTFGLDLKKKKHRKIAKKESPAMCQIEKEIMKMFHEFNAEKQADRLGRQKRLML